MTMTEKLKEQLAALAAMSNRFGADAAYVLAGGGNTSFKNEANLWIKGSGTSLATIRPEDFVVMDRKALATMWETAYPEEEAAREAAVLADMMASRIPGESRRPSVETLLHDLFPQSYVLHLHPAAINGLTCSAEGEKAMNRLYPEAVWVDACKPGYILASLCRQKMAEYQEKFGKPCDVLFLQNHGIFLAADTAEEVSEMAVQAMNRLLENIRRQPELQAQSADSAKVAAISAALGKLWGTEFVEFLCNPEILRFDPSTKGLSPDHIVYCKARQLILPADVDEAQIPALFAAFEAENGYKPKVAFAQNLGMFSIGASAKEAHTAQSVMLDAIKVTAYADSFGGVQPMADWLIDFIVNWEVESYRQKVSN